MLETLEDALAWVKRYGNVGWDVESLKRGLRTVPVSDVRAAMYYAKLVHNRTDDEVSRVLMLLIME